MKKINALALRHSLTKIIETLQKTGEPILLEKGRKPAAVIISLDDFRMRFIEKDADDKRIAIKEKILNMRKKSHNHESAESILREMRAG